MIRTLLIFMPLFVSVFWMIILTLMAFRTNTYRAFMLLLSFTAVAVFANSVLGDFSTTTQLKNYAIIIKQVTTTSLAPLTILYIRRIRRIDRTQHPYELLWIIAPIALGTAAALLYMLSGDESIAQMMKDIHNNGYNVLKSYENTLPYVNFIFTQVIYTVVVLVEIVWLFIYFIVLHFKEHFRLGHILDFYFRGGRIKTVELQVFLMVVLFAVFGTRFFISLDLTTDFPVWNVIVSLLICYCMFSISHVALFGSKRTLTLKEIRNAWRYNYNQDNKQRIVEEMMLDLIEDANEEVRLDLYNTIGEKFNIHPDVADAAGAHAMTEQLFSAVPKSMEDDNLLKRFQQLMVEEKVFLQPKLTLIDVADMLGSNTTYVSKMVNSAYNLGFPEFVNTLRVDYAEEYILTHRDAKQTEIAEKCGFLSASSFNTIFKRITGMTPKIWVASVEQPE